MDLMSIWQVSECPVAVWSVIREGHISSWHRGDDVLLTANRWPNWNHIQPDSKYGKNKTTACSLCCRGAGGREPWISFTFQVSYSGSEVSAAYSEVRLWPLGQLVWPTLKTSAVDSPPNLTLRNLRPNLTPVFHSVTVNSPRASRPKSPCLSCMYHGAPSPGLVSEWNMGDALIYHVERDEGLITQWLGPPT